MTQFDGEKCYQHIHQLCVTIGPRVSGSEGERQAMEYVKAQFESYRLKTWVGEFDVDAYHRQEARLEITDPPLGEIPAGHILGCPDTPPGGLEAEVVWVESVNEPEIGPFLEGKIVMAEMGRNLTGSMDRLLKYKPAAILAYGNTLAEHPLTYDAEPKEKNDPPDLPTMMIPYLEAVRLFNAPIRRARITTQIGRRPGKSYYVTGEKPGALFPDEIVVIGGHMDSVPFLQGATDNAAGTATVLELARVFAQRDTKRTLRFAAWGSEEAGLLGSKKYVFELKAKAKTEKEAVGFVEGVSKTELDRHIFNINLDVLGMSLGSDFATYLGEDALGAYVGAVASEMGIPLKVTKETYGSDGLSFSWENIPSISFARRGPGWDLMHTRGDEIGLISPRQLEKIGRLVEVFMQRTITDGYIFPFPRQASRELIEKDPHVLKLVKAHAGYLGFSEEEVR
jgi:aminopeptidase YwaD